MIGFLRGKLVHKAPPFLVLDVQGIGYEVEAPITTFYDLPAINEEIKLHTHLVVREARFSHKKLTCSSMETKASGESVNFSIVA
jgi:Holliday junction resolvasome RuvABC DNA-binding subunit